VCCINGEITVAAGCLAFEFAMGLFGIYANFKSVFFVLVVAATASPLALRGRRLAATIVCFGILFVSGVVWTQLKMDYRGSSPMQRRLMKKQFRSKESSKKLADLLSSVTWENFTDGMDALIMAHQLCELLRPRAGNVPNRVPYEDGELWKGSIMHVLTPRFLFPDKPVLDDSERTRTLYRCAVSE